MLKHLAAVTLALALGAGTALAQTTTTPTPATPPAASKSTAPVAQPAKPAATKDLVDLNTATAKDLAKLPGLNETQAEAIVKARPYKGKDELVQKKIVPETVFAQIKDQITVKTN
jgi:competence protein ComEA